MQKLFYDKVDEVWDLKPSPESCAPIFLVASVWRTGSTLTQRLLVSSKNLLMWGEPFANSSIIQNLQVTTKPFLDPQTQYAWRYFTPTRLEPVQRERMMGAMDREWIANFYPDIAELKASYRAMLDHLFSGSAKKEGYQRFGGKFVRLNVEHVQFLQWIYPDARIVFLTRNPYDAWNSYNGCNWTYSYPNLKVSKIVPFMKIWAKNTQDFLQHKTPNSAFFRYEDIIQRPESREALRQHCLLPTIDESILQIRQTGMSSAQVRKGISGHDIKQIGKITGTLASSLGYVGHRNTLPKDQVALLS
jgi:hypothetical protein